MFQKIGLMSFLILVFFGFSSVAFGENFGLDNDENGGDCNKIGIWDNPSSTCFLSRDLEKNDQILLININGVTLDGQGHHIIGDGLSDGIYVGNSNNIKIINMQISNTRNGIFLNNSSDNMIANNTVVWNTEHGIWAINESHNNIIKNNLSGFNIQHGISIGDADNSYIIDNLVSHTKDAIRLEKANYNTVSGNYVWENRVEGIDLHESSENLIYNNNVFFTLIDDVLDDCGECNSKYFLNNMGNYYEIFDESAEGCNDLDSDGICDEPFVFSEGIDQYPSVSIIKGNIPNPYMHDFPLKFDDWETNKELIESSSFISDWKQNIALWYYNEETTEKEFTNSIEYLLKNEIITIPPISNVEIEESSIPPEIKIRIGLWSYGLTDNEEFIDIVHSLAEKGLV
ncbi:MAG: right-handed parallel beta-helix repeat-containing protein [Nitrosopumilus sp.]|nr:right-handed parallel beta-helix repeat-containing protein [Nitrosopumilus sp.]